MRTIGMTLIALTIIVCSINAQNSESHFYLYGNLVLPTGDFAETKGEFGESSSGYAVMGFGATIEYGAPTGTDALVWRTSVSLLMNGVEGSRIVDDDDWYDYDIGNWYNFPFLTGLSYGSPISPTAQIFGVGQIGVNFAIGPSIENIEEDFEATSNMMTTFAFSLGAGLEFSEKILVLLRYANLGSGKLEYDVTEKGREEEGFRFERDIPITMFVLSLGLRL